MFWGGGSAGICLNEKACGKRGQIDYFVKGGLTGRFLYIYIQLQILNRYCQILQIMKKK
jgi:hypothetical protein